LLVAPTSIFIPVKNIPIDLVVERASDIPKDIYDGSSSASVGITGSDILCEAGLENAGEDIPVYPEDSGPSLYAGVYSANSDKYSELEDLDGQLIATKYPRITQDIADRRGISLKMKVFSGKIEGKNNLYPNLVGLTDIISSGNTAKLNKIKILEKIYKISARMIDAPGRMTPMELSFFDDLRELIAVYRQRKR